MQTVNEQIADLSVGHQVGLQRLSSSVVRRLIPILNKADKEIVDKLLARESTLSGSFTSKRLQYLLRSVREINRDAHLQFGAELREELRELGGYEVAFQKRLLNKVLPIAFDIVTPSAEMLQAVVTSRPLQGKLLKEWASELSAGSYRRVRDAIRMGMVQGETVGQMVRRIRGTRAARFNDGVVGVGRRAAEAVVRTAVNHTASAAREVLYAENTGIIKSITWVATLDTRTCPQCQSLDGKTYEMGKGPRPPAHINCRCTTAPVTKSWRELGFDINQLPPGTRASMNGQVPASQDFNSWLKTQSASIQDDALGPTRGNLFRKGGVSVDRFVNRTGDQWTLDELRVREAKAFDAIGV